MKTKDLTRIAMLAAILYAIYFMGSSFMYIELVGFTVLLYGVSLDRKISCIAAAIFALLVMLTKGIGIWSFMYLLIYPLYALIYYYLSKVTKSEYIYAAVGFIITFMTGTILESPYILIQGLGGKALITYLISGFQVSLGNAACTLIAALFLLKPLKELLQKLSNK